jgi:hypothetical protein
LPGKLDKRQKIALRGIQRPIAETYPFDKVLAFFLPHRRVKVAYLMRLGVWRFRISFPRANDIVRGPSAHNRDRAFAAFRRA